MMDLFFLDLQRVLEALTIILSGTQLLCTIAIRAGVINVISSSARGGRV